MWWKINIWWWIFKWEKWNGKGYDLKGNFIFELKNGNGYIKEYHNNTLIFEGEYLNGKKWNGKGYDIKGNSIYELKNGQGYVKEYEYEKLVFEDEYLNGEINGKGKEHNQFGGLF